MYSIYIGNILLPVNPESIKWSYKRQNETINLINMEEINRINIPGLMEFSFSAVLPGGKVPYARYLTSYKEPFVYLNELEAIMKERRTVIFIIKREKLPYMRVGFTTKKLVTIEDLSVNEEAKEGLDIKFDIRLKEYKAAQSTKIGNISQAKARNETKTAAKSYVVKSGDSLWNICKRELNDGGKFAEIAKLNGITDPSKIYTGQVIKFE